MTLGYIFQSTVYRAKLDLSVFWNLGHLGVDVREGIWDLIFLYRDYEPSSDWHAKYFQCFPFLRFFGMNYFLFVS